MIDIIFIAFQFPPLSVGGTFRPRGFAEHLPENGIRPYIYTLSPEDYKNVYNPVNTDRDLLNSLKDRDILIRTVRCGPVWGFYESKLKRFANIYFNLYRGNEYKKWGESLIKEVRRDAKRVDFKAVVVTAPPFGMLKLAKRIADELKLPLILDMRDAWTFWNLNGYGTYLHFLANKWLERKYLKAADKVISTSQQTIDDWLSIHPKELRKKMYCVTNGYDIQNELLIKDEVRINPLRQKDSFIIAYVGSFYYSPEARENMLLPFYKRKGLRKLQYYLRKQDWLYRTPYFFFRAVNTLLANHPELRNVIRIKFAGTTQEWLKKMVQDFSLEENVEFYAYLSREESLKTQESADALLLTSAKVYGGNDCFIAGKTFEYFKLQKPILAFVSPGAQKYILEGSGLSINLDPDDDKGASEQLFELVTKGVRLKPNKDYLLEFSRKRLTEKFANIIKEAIP